MNETRNGTKSIQTYEEVLGKYEPVIGLEIHCQLKTNTKLFCACSSEFGALPNHNTCPVCLGYPGALPVLNKTAVDYAIRMALAIGADLHELSQFARKQYFYPDLPKGYQITQHDKPYSTGGKIVLDDGAVIGVTRIHIEEDAGKNIHGDNASYVDLNRAGTPLIEMVSEPHIKSPAQASEYLKKVRAIVRYLDICDGNLEEGSFRCDANVSLRPKGAEKLGTRCEIKNLNSFKNIEKALIYEMIRQANILESGERVVQQTRQFDVASGKTFALRSKEESNDYRYFPEPDLMPLHITGQRIEEIKRTLPELPEAAQRRFQDQFGLGDYDAAVLTSDKDLAKYYQAVVAAAGEKVSPKIAANWVLSEFLREANNRGWNLVKPFVTAESLASLLRLLDDETISGRIAKVVFEEMAETGKSPKTIIAEKNLVQVSDPSSINQVIEAVIKGNPGQLQEYLAGRDRLFPFFVGQVMKESKGKFNPGLVNQLLKEKLDALKN
jgi:aspartyl-tRNA(Asn)/glutamyl-tRNA(Gln) amidotransferase subunit B